MSEKTEIIKFRIDNELKTDVEHILREQGITLSEAIDLFFEKICEVKGIPFPLIIPDKGDQVFYENRSIPEDVLNAVRIFKEKVSDILSVKKAFLFGSYAKGIYREESDIDVCIIAEKIENNYLAALEIAPLSIDVDVRIESVVFSIEEYEHEESFGVLREVKEHGIEI